MQKGYRQLITSTLIGLMTIGSLNAAPSIVSEKLVQADKNIKNLKPAIEYVRNHSKLEVVFPTQVPQEGTSTLYAAYDSYYSNPNYNKYWTIDISTQAGCKVKNCIVGSVTAEKDGRLDVDYLQAPFGENNKPILKEKVKLANNITGFYTPGHTEADWHPPKIEWKNKDVLYSITWEIKENARQVLTQMANS